MTESRGSHGPFSHRPIVWGSKYMVGAGTQLTAQSGLRVLAGGGNAVDAAVAAALAGGVLEPTAHYTLGGEIAMLFYDASSGRVRSIVGQGWAPAAATIELYRERWGRIPPGVHSTTVPGVISALLQMLAEYGTLSFGQVVADARHLAADGFAAYQLFCRALATPERQANLRAHADSARAFLPGDRAPELGERFRQPDLAATLSSMVQAEENALQAGQTRAAAIGAARDQFYRGDVAARMVDALQELGGLHTLDDFASYESPFEEPLSITYRDCEIFTNRTWTQGVVLLQALALLDGFDLGTSGHNSADAIHWQVEALKLAFADRERYAGDPACVDVPVSGLLSADYAEMRRALIDPGRARSECLPGDPVGMRSTASSASPTPHEAIPPGDGDGTTHLAVADSQGNLVSATPSTFAGLSQGMVLGDTGILINCRGCYFWLDPENPNALAPRKRPRTTPCTFIVLKEGHPFMTLGTPGGDSQPQSCLQVLCNIVDFGLDVQEAVAAPRFCSYSFPQSPWPHGSAPNRLDIEGRLADTVSAQLRARGHLVDLVGPWDVVNGFAPILVDPDGTYRGGADPRRESVMLGW